MAKKLISLILAVLLFVMVVCSCSTAAEETEPEVITEEVTDVTSYLSEQEWMETVDSNYVEQIDGVTTAVVSEWYENYTINVAYPVIANFDQISADIKAFVDGKISNFEQEVKANGDKKFDAKPELTITYQPFVYADSTLSFKFVTYSDSGVSRTVNYIDTFVFDKNTGEKIGISDLFREDSDYLTVLSDTVRAKLKDNAVIREYNTENMLTAGTSPVESNFSKFVIGSEDLRFYYNQGDIAPLPAGSFEAAVKHEELSDVLSEAFKNGTSLLEPSSASPANLPAYLQSGENDMTAFSLDGIDPINDKVIAITFDDGPAADKTMKVVEAFQAVGGKCTFFEVGVNVESNPDIVKQVYDAGMEIGNHGYNHINYYKSSYEEMVEDLEKTADAIQSACGKRPIIFRAPYGNVEADAAERYGRQSVYWTIDTLDWKNRDVDMNYENAVNEAYDGAVVLMHDIHQETVDSVPRIVNRLAELGYKFVTVSQLDQILIARGQDPTWRLGRDASTHKPKDLDSGETAGQ